MHGKAPTATRTFGLIARNPLKKTCHSSTWKLLVPDAAQGVNSKRATGYPRVQYGGFPKLGGTLLAVPVIRIIKLGGLYWCPRIFGNYHISDRQMLGQSRVMDRELRVLQDVKKSCAGSRVTRVNLGFMLSLNHVA